MVIDKVQFNENEQSQQPLVPGKSVNKVSNSTL